METRAVEAYDIRSRRWSRRAPLPTARAAGSLVALAPRPASKGSPTVIYASGESFSRGGNGQGHDVFEEYDVAADVWYCHRNLPYTFHGAPAAVDTRGRLHFVSGAEWFYYGATRRVIVYDLAAAPPPEPCMYEHRRVTDMWANTAKPFNLPYEDFGTAPPRQWYLSRAASAPDRGDWEHEWNDDKVVGRKLPPSKSRRLRRRHALEIGGVEAGPI